MYEILQLNGSNIYFLKKKRGYVFYEKIMLILYLKFDKNKFSNIGTVDQSWIHFFDPLKKSVIKFEPQNLPNDLVWPDR